MSKYTTQVRFLVENYTIDLENESISKRINSSLPKIFNFDYPIFDESYRRTLERKIIMHYINKEIAFETVGLWKLYLEERLNLIMPYYNELYKTTIKQFDYLTDFKTSEESNAKKISSDIGKNSLNNVDNVENTGTNSQENSGTNTDNSKNNITESNTSKLKNLKSDLPQANFQGLDYGTELNENEDNSTKNSNSNNEVTSNFTSNFKGNVTNKTASSGLKNGNFETTKNANETNLITRIGYNSSPSNLIMEYRKILINIDKMIIDELYDLFMLIY